MDKFRNEIDTIDTQILELLAKRIACAKEIGKIKTDKGEEV